MPSQYRPPLASSFTGINRQLGHPITDSIHLSLHPFDICSQLCPSPFKSCDLLDAGIRCISSPGTRELASIWETSYVFRRISVFFSAWQSLAWILGTISPLPAASCRISSSLFFSYRKLSGSTFTSPRAIFRTVCGLSLLSPAGAASAQPTPRPLSLTQLLCPISTAHTGCPHLLVLLQPGVPAVEAPLSHT